MLYNLFENRDFVSVFAVALLAEGVDRNIMGYAMESATAVALLAEGVDRNWTSTRKRRPKPGSPSSRRAWIEIHIDAHHHLRVDVALLAEGVDRNCDRHVLAEVPAGRPPRGGRG